MDTDTKGTKHEPYCLTDILIKIDAPVLAAGCGMNTKIKILTEF
jgi:hypothetical protein